MTVENKKGRFGKVGGQYVPENRNAGTESAGGSL